MNTRGIPSWPKSDRPREKLLSLGEQQLTDSELLAVIIGSGTQRMNALDLARTILKQSPSFRSLSQLNGNDLKKFKGLGQAKIAQIKAAIEIGRRFYNESSEDNRPQIDASGDVARLLMGKMRDLPKETVQVVYLNSQNRILATSIVEEGTVNRACPILREIFSQALSHNASALICVHNHPSGDCHPSAEDKQFTLELRQAGEVLGIAVLDHIIIGNNAYYSFSDHE